MKSKSKVIILSIICVVVVMLLGVLGYFIYIQNTYLSKDEIKKIVLEDTKLNSKDVVFKEIEMDSDGEAKTYDVEFYYNRVEYKYEIEAKTGVIIYSNFINESSNDNQNSNDIQNSNYISIDDAKNIALEDAKLSTSEVTFTDVDLLTSNGKSIYEVEFYSNNLEYEYKIDGINKNIISKKQEPRD